VTPDFIGLGTFTVAMGYLLAYEFRPELYQNPVTMALFALLAYLTFLDFQAEYILWIIPLFIIANIGLRKTIPLFTAILTTAFVLAFFTLDGFSTNSGWTLLFFQRSSSWAVALLSNQFIDLVLRPFLRTLLAALMIITMYLLWSSSVQPRAPQPGQVRWRQNES
jgi:hypothetical protein